MSQSKREVVKYSFIIPLEEKIYFSIFPPAYIDFFNRHFKFLKEEVKAIWLPVNKRPIPHIETEIETTLRILKSFIKENIYEYFKNNKVILFNVEYFWRNRYNLGEEDIKKEKRELLNLFLKLLTNLSSNKNSLFNSSSYVISFLSLSSLSAYIFDFLNSFQEARQSVLSDSLEFENNGQIIEFFQIWDEKMNNFNSFNIGLLFFYYVLYWSWVVFISKTLHSFLKQNELLKSIFPSYRDFAFNKVLPCSLTDFIFLIKSYENFFDKLLYTENKETLLGEFRFIEYSVVKELF